MASLRRERITNNDSLSQRVAYGAGTLILSLPFLGAGTFFALYGFEWIDVDLDGVNAPLWVIGLVGLAFFLAGALIGVNSLRSVVHRARMREQQRLHPGRRWLSDFPWDQQGAKDNALGKVFGAFLGLGFFVVFLAPFNWWAFVSDSGVFFVKVIVCLFDLILLLVAWKVVTTVAHFVRYGHSRVVYEEFPFFLGSELRVRFSPGGFDRIYFSLRCVEEFWETSGTGNRRSRRLVCDQLYADEQVVEASPTASEVDVRFQLPGDPELATRFDPLPVRYWQLRAQADVPGIDLDTCLPVPVYESRSATGTNRKDAKSAKALQ